MEKSTADAFKKRDRKEKSGQEAYKLTKKFTVYVGDDTGLLKRVAMQYNYRTDVFGDAKKEFSKPPALSAPKGEKDEEDSDDDDYDGEGL